MGDKSAKMESLVGVSQLQVSPIILSKRRQRPQHLARIKNAKESAINQLNHPQYHSYQ